MRQINCSRGESNRICNFSHIRACRKLRWIRIGCRQKSYFTAVVAEVRNFEGDQRGRVKNIDSVLIRRRVKIIKWGQEPEESILRWREREVNNAFIMKNQTYSSQDARRASIGLLEVAREIKVRGCGARYYSVWT